MGANPVDSFTVAGFIHIEKNKRKGQVTDEKGRTCPGEGERAMVVDLRAKLGVALDTIRDQVSVGRAMMRRRSNRLSEIEIAVIRATCNGNTPMDDRFMHEILFLVSDSPGSISFLADQITRRLGSTRDGLVALKTLVLIHRLIRGGNRDFEDRIRDAHFSGHLQMSTCWWWMKGADSSVDFLRSYADYLMERMGWVINTGGKLEPVVSRSFNFEYYKERSLELIFHILPKCQSLLDKVLNCWQFENLGPEPSKLALAAMSNTLKESFQVYRTFSEGITALLDMFFDLTLPARAVACNILRKASDETDKLRQLYTRCNQSMKGRNLEFPSVKVITMDHVKILEECLGSPPTGTLDSQSSRLATRPGRAKVGKELGDSDISLSSSGSRFSWTMETKISYVWVVFEEDDEKEEPL
ncbi:hypothetical protein MLD38_001592 [Melastoma candidum]|uniref:Uncharacterized protein n=1 Tax=Melastoma candidum TaxID=119954 RepID=A0ACB9SEQ9_9MYRT|nr:hypothetical protein MLD38_001592 [Melastoma candidum]